MQRVTFLTVFITPCLSCFSPDCSFMVHFNPEHSTIRLHEQNIREGMMDREQQKDRMGGQTVQKEGRTFSGSSSAPSAHHRALIWRRQENPGSASSIGRKEAGEERERER